MGGRMAWHQRPCTSHEQPHGLRLSMVARRLASVRKHSEATWSGVCTKAQTCS